MVEEDSSLIPVGGSTKSYNEDISGIPLEQLYEWVKDGKDTSFVELLDEDRRYRFFLDVEPSDKNSKTPVPINSIVNRLS